MFPDSSFFHVQVLAPLDIIDIRYYNDITNIEHR